MRSMLPRVWTGVGVEEKGDETEERPDDTKETPEEGETRMGVAVICDDGREVGYGENRAARDE